MAVRGLGQAGDAALGFEGDIRKLGASRALSGAARPPATDKVNFGPEDVALPFEKHTKS
jgi:hypothetical protein